MIGYSICWSRRSRISCKAAVKCPVRFFCGVRIWGGRMRKTKIINIICNALATQMYFEYTISVSYKVMKGVHLYGYNERKYDFTSGT